MLFLNGADTKAERGGDAGTRDVHSHMLLAAAVAAPIDDACAMGDANAERAVDARADAAEAAAAKATAVPVAPALPPGGLDAKAAAAAAAATQEALLDAAAAAVVYAAVDVRLCDFDDVLYRVCVGVGRCDGAKGVGHKAGMRADFGGADAAHTLRVHMSAPFFASASAVGALAALRDRYGALLAPVPAPDADVTLCVDLRTLRGAKADAKDALVQSIAQLKFTAIGGVFQHFFRALAPPPVTGAAAGASAGAGAGDAKAAPAAAAASRAGGAGAVQPFAFPIRNDTTVWFVPELGGGSGAASDPKVHVTYSVSFRDRVDRAVALTFLSGFVEVEGMAHALRHGARPKFAFTKLPPLQVASAFGLTGAAVPKRVMGYASFTVTPAHVRTTEQRAKLAATLQGFRTFLQYHVKCSKALFHSQMRARAHHMLQRVTTAKAQALVPAQVRTISGRYFQRRDGPAPAPALGAGAGAALVTAAA